MVHQSLSLGGSSDQGLPRAKLLPNLAEAEFSALARDLPEQVGDRLALERYVAVWQRRNDAEVTANWPFTTANARINLRRLYPTVSA